MAEHLDNTNEQEQVIKNETGSTETENRIDDAQGEVLSLDANQGSSDFPESILFNTPIIPETVYSNLPEFLKDNCAVFETSREKDVFLTGALTILSGCLNAVEGIYDGREVFANINCFVVAPAASGKGVFVYAKMLGDAYHQKLLNRSRANAKASQPSVSNKNDGTLNAPVSLLFIPGNTSASAIISHLEENGGKGIVCETEADTLSGSLKQDWGNFSDLLRKSFHHEHVSFSRKGNNEYIEINKPRLSIALSGTPSQVQSLIPSAEDGSFSRFIFYAFNGKAEWRDVSPGTGKPNLTKHFEEQSLKVLELVEFTDANPFTFNLTKEQWDAFNNQFEIWFREVYSSVGGDATSTVKRLGLIAYRFAMILTSIRRYEEQLKTEEAICSQLDFQVAMQLVGVFKAHSLLMYGRLPQSGSTTERTLLRFFDALPNRFTREKAVIVGKELDLRPRTVDKYLELLWKSSQLKKTKAGHYSKK